MEFDEGLEFPVLQLQGHKSALILLPLGGSLLSFPGPQWVVFGDEFSFLVLLPKGRNGGGVNGFAAQDGSELSVLSAFLDFAEDAEFVGDGEASSGSPLADLWIRQHSDGLVRHEWITFSP